MFFSDDCDESESNSMDLPSEDFKGSAPPVTFSQDETHDHNLLPRMGVGIAKCPHLAIQSYWSVEFEGRLEQNQPKERELWWGMVKHVH